LFDLPSFPECLRAQAGSSKRQPLEIATAVICKPDVLPVAQPTVSAFMPSREKHSFLILLSAEKKGCHVSDEPL